MKPNNQISWGTSLNISKIHFMRISTFNTFFLLKKMFYQHIVKGELNYWSTFIDCRQPFRIAAYLVWESLTRQAGCGSSIVCASAWYADGRWFNPHVRPQNILSLRFSHEKILRPFSPFCWVKKGSCQFLAKEWALSTGKLPRRLAQEQCV